MKVVKALHERENPCYEFGPFRLDPTQRVLLREGEPVVLLPKSFDVLSVLVQNSGKLLDKDFLLTSVWSDAVVEENSIAKAITDIRKTLGEGPKENRFIATVARRGYRFVAKVTSSRPTEDKDPERDAQGSEKGSARLTRIAVLPLDWLTQEGSDGSLSVGLADALITRLSNLSQIVVRPTSSILKYAEGGRDAVAVASELRVDYLITGSLQQAGERVRVTVQMVSPNEPRIVWADHFEEAFTHVFSIEDSMSERVAAALALKLTASQKEFLVRRGTGNIDAYQLYLRGRYFWSKQTLASAEKAIAYFRQALDLDPGYAGAWAGIADAYVLIGLSGALTGGLPPYETYPQAKRAALAAIALQEELAEAHAALGFVSFFYDWDSRRAQQAFDRAISLHPHYSHAHHGRALAAGFLGRYEESLNSFEAALEIEPLALILNTNKGYVLYVAGRYEAAMAQLKKTLEIDPSFAATHHRLGLVYSALGRDREAISHLLEAQRLSDDSPQALGALGYIYARTGDETAARAVMRRAEEISKTRHVSPVIIAEVQTGLGQYDEALASLEKAVHERAGALVTVRVDPRFERLRSEARCRQLLQNLGSLV